MSSQEIKVFLQGKKGRRPGSFFPPPPPSSSFILFTFPLDDASSPHSLSLLLKFGDGV